MNKECRKKEIAVSLLKKEGVMMGYFFKTVFSKALLLVMVSLLTGCMTSKLNREIDRAERGGYHSSDVISALAVTESIKSEGKKYKWVFIGSHFDYVLTSGADDFLKALVTEKIDRARIIIVQNRAYFYVDKKASGFQGRLSLIYQYRDQAEREYVKSHLKLDGNNCINEGGKQSGGCSIYLENLTGTIHQKVVTPNDVLRLNTPFKVDFYQRGAISAQRVLYPVTAALDIVTLPLLLISGIAMVGLISTMN